MAVIVARGLPRAGKAGAPPLELENFCESVAMLAWAKDNGCQWDVKTSQTIACDGNLKVLQWAREHDCPWDEDTCSMAAGSGQGFAVVHFSAQRKRFL